MMHACVCVFVCLCVCVCECVSAPVSLLFRCLVCFTWAVVAYACHIAVQTHGVRY